jgi:hypothetical protein
MTEPSPRNMRNTRKKEKVFCVIPRIPWADVLKSARIVW